MKKITLALVIVLLLSACSLSQIPGFSTPTALPEASSLPATNTSVPPSTLPSGPVNPTETPPQLFPTAEVTSSFTTTPSPDLTTTPATSTDLPVNPTVTINTTAVSGLPTTTPTLGILLYGTLPPAVPFNTITVWNRSKAQAYISLQVTLNDGRYAILEYPVGGQINIKAPVGTYIYVAWVGGNKLTGGFNNHSNDSLLITLFKDKVVIK